MVPILIQGTTCICWIPECNRRRSICSAWFWNAIDSVAQSD